MENAVVTYQLSFGAFHSARMNKNLARLRALQFEMLPFDKEEAECAGEIRARLTESGQMIGPYDLLIAGRALARGLTLVTHDAREFSLVEGLTVED